MWILQMFKDTLNASFEFFLGKISGRFWAFLFQLIVSYVAVAIFTLLITVIIIPLFNQGSFELDLDSFDGWFNWIRMIDPVWTVTIAIAINGLFNLDSEQKKMSFVDFYNNKSSQFWMELLIAVSILSAVFVIYYKSEFLLSLSDQTPLELLLDNGFENTRNTFSVFLSNWMSYLVTASPIVAIVIVELRERRRNGVILVTPVWKVVITLILLKFILAWLFIDLVVMFNELVMSLIYIPFRLIEIPAILGIFVTLFFNTLHFMMLTAVIHFTLKLASSGSKIVRASKTSNDLLDN